MPISKDGFVMTNQEQSSEQFTPLSAEATPVAAEKDIYVVTVTVESTVQLEVEANSKDEAKAKAFQWRSYDDPWPYKSDGYYENENGEWVTEDFEINADIQDCNVVSFVEVSKVVDRDTGETEPC